MINPNKPVARIVLVVLVLLTSAYLFTQSFHFTFNQDQVEATRFPDDYFEHTNTAWQHTNPTNLTYPHKQFKAAFYTFVKSNHDSLGKLRRTIRNLEDTFNSNRHYPYIIFSDEDLDEEYRELASSLIDTQKTTMMFVKVGDDLYGYEASTDMEKAAEARIKLNNTMFGDSEDYRFQSRFMAGTIFRHPLMQELDYMWRFEAGTEYICPLHEDPFQYMYDNKKTTSFSMALYEYQETIPSLFSTVLKFADQHKDWIQPRQDPNTLWHFVLNDQNGFNGCHLWNNLQIADASFYRGEKYQAFFDYLDKSNGIFYERWGDPVIQSLGALLFLNKDDIHFWDTIGYRVANYFTHCPTQKSLYSHCSCRPSENFDYNGYSCLRFY